MVAILLITATIGFAAASALFLRHVLNYKPGVPRVGVLTMAATTAVLAAAAFIELGEIEPAVLLPAQRVVLLVAIGVPAIYMLIKNTWSTPAAGLVLAPLGTVVTLALWVKATTVSAPMAGSGTLGALTAVHIGAAILGFLLFIPAYVLSVLFLNQEHRLKTKQLDGVRLPSLLTLEQHAWRLLYIGFPLYTVGISLGFLSSRNPAVHHGFQLQYGFAALSWLIYAVAISMRIRTGWRGRRAALTLMAAFVVTFAAVLLYMMR